MPSFCAMWIQSAAVGTVESDAALTTAPAFLRRARGNELLGFSIAIKRDTESPAGSFATRSRPVPSSPARVLPRHCRNLDWAAHMDSSRRWLPV